MNDAVQNAPEAGAVRPVLLRASREAAGLHIAALAAALKVPVRKLEALEAGRYEELPDLTFARALASSACRHLKVDPAPILEQIPQGTRSRLGDTQAINAPFKPASDPAPASPLSWLSRPALLAAIVLLLGALVIVFLPRVQESATQANSTDAVVVTPVEPVAAVEPVSPAPMPADAPAVEPAPVSTAAPVGAVAVAAPEPVSAPTAVANAGAPGSLLSIAATRESWVEVVNGSGSVVMQRVLKPGDTIDFSTSPPYSVVLGRADAAQVTVRGQPLDVTAIARNNVARFEVK